MERMQMPSSRTLSTRNLVGGVMVALVALVAGVIGRDVVFGLLAFAVVVAFTVYVCFSRTEWAAVQRADADERQRDINMRAMQIAYMVVVVVAVIGWLDEVARGPHAGPFTLICAVGGFTHMGAIAYLRRRN